MQINVNATANGKQVMCVSITNDNLFTLVNGYVLDLVINILFVFCVVTQFCMPYAVGQEEPANQQAIEQKQKINETENNLSQIFTSIESVRKDIEAKQTELSGPSGKGREEQLTSEIKDLSSTLSKLETAFSEIATGVDFTLLDHEPAEDFSWERELKDLLLPIINEVKRLSSRPREIDSYRRQIKRHEEYLALINQGLESVSKLEQGKLSNNAKKYLSKLKANWQERQQQRSTEMRIIEQKLEQRLGEQHDILRSASTVFDIFFRSRMRNLFLAFFITGLFWLALRRMRSVVQRQMMQQMPSLQLLSRFIEIRVINVLFFFFTSIGSIVIFMLTLFLLNDWVLVTVCIMFLLGVAWSSKHALPHFWNQAAVLLNMGPIREGERVYYCGVPFKVATLNFYSELVNPELQGGVVRLPIYDMPELRSRPSGVDESWFPTKKDDWVLLADAVFGQVILQTPEHVVVRLLGGAEKIYQTGSFVGQDPVVLSRGFRHSITFGIDYSHQAKITTEIPKVLEDYIRKELTSSGYGGAVRRLNVEFNEASASALVVVVLIDFHGDVAARYELLARLIQRICVDACNEHNWSIPFDQLTVHVDKI